MYLPPRPTNEDPEAIFVLEYFTSLLRNENNLSNTRVTETSEICIELWQFKQILDVHPEDPDSRAEDSYIFTLAAVGLQTTGRHGVTHEAVQHFHNSSEEVRESLIDTAREQFEQIMNKPVQQVSDVQTKQIAAIASVDAVMDLVLPLKRSVNEETSVEKWPKDSPMVVDKPVMSDEEFALALQKQFDRENSPTFENGDEEYARKIQAEWNNQAPTGRVSDQRLARSLQTKEDGGVKEVIDLDDSDDDVFFKVLPKKKQA